MDRTIRVLQSHFLFSPSPTDSRPSRRRIPINPRPSHRRKPIQSIFTRTNRYITAGGARLSTRPPNQFSAWLFFLLDWFDRNSCSSSRISRTALSRALSPSGCQPTGREYPGRQDWHTTSSSPACLRATLTPQLSGRKTNHNRRNRCGRPGKIRDEAHPALARLQATARSKGQRPGIVRRCGSCDGRSDASARWVCMASSV